MKLVYNPIVHDLSGTCGNAVYSRWRGVPYIRSLTLPRDPNTPAQQAVRLQYSRVAYLWRKIDSDGRHFWNLYAAGQSMSGYNRFLAENHAPPGIAFLARTTPFNPDLDPPPHLAVAEGVMSNTIDVTWDGGPWPADHYIYVYAHGGNIATFEQLSKLDVLANDHSATLNYVDTPPLNYLFLSIHDSVNNVCSESILRSFSF